MDKVKKLISSNRGIITNISYLSILQIFNILLPLVTYPYLVRTLGTGKYGEVIFAQIVASYFSIFVDFGFKLSATRDISVHRYNRTRLSEIISSVLIIKIILWLLSLVVLVAILPWIDGDRLIFIFSFGICFNELLFPQWYFQGIEKMKIITIINVFTRSLFVILIFVFVKKETDALMVPVFNGLGAFIGGVIGLYVMFFKDEVKFKIPSIVRIKYYFLSSLSLFFSYLVIAVKDRFSYIFIGLSLGMKEIAIYDLAVKITSVFTQFIDVLINSTFPIISKMRDMKWMLKFMKIAFIAMALLILISQIILSPLINYIGDGELNASVSITRVLLVAPLILIVSMNLGRNCLIVFGKNKEFTFGMLFTTLFYLVLLLIAYINGFTENVLTFVIIALSSYLFELGYRYYLVKKLNLL